MTASNLPACPSLESLRKQAKLDRSIQFHRPVLSKLHTWLAAQAMLPPAPQALAALLGC